MSAVYDLKLVNRDLDFGPDDEPLALSDTDAIAQDVQTRLEAEGVAADLVADDLPDGVAQQRIAFAVEEDTRIKPGTAAVMAGNTAGTWEVTATAYSGEALTLLVSA